MSAFNEHWHAHTRVHPHPHPHTLSMQLVWPAVTPAAGGVTCMASWPSKPCSSQGSSRVRQGPCIKFKGMKECSVRLGQLTLHAWLPCLSQGSSRVRQGPYMNFKGRGSALCNCGSAAGNRACFAPPWSEFVDLALSVLKELNLDFTPFNPIPSRILNIEGELMAHLCQSCSAQVCWYGDLSSFGRHGRNDGGRL
jgi:hypothetical protein